MDIPLLKKSREGYNSPHRELLKWQGRVSGSKSTVKMEEQIYSIIARQPSRAQGSRVLTVNLEAWRRNRRSVPVEESWRVGLAGHGDSPLLPGWL